jgi:hypothetical protein
MADSRSGQSSGGEAKQEAPSPESHPAAEAFSDLNQLISDVRALGSQLLNDAAALAVAQWRLTSYVLTGSARIWTIRLAAFVAIAALALASWIFLNVAAWRATGDFTDLSYAPPLVLFLLNLATGAALYVWQRGLKLQ